MPYLERPAGRLFYEDGQGDGPCVLFSHGIFMDLRMFDDQVEALQPEFRCIRWDERGHGRTESIGSFTYWDLAEDLLALMHHCDVDQAVFVGMSQGGFISQRAALEAPERVGGLFFINTQAGEEPEHTVPMYEALHEQWAREGPTAEVAEAVATIILDPADHEPWVSEWLERPADYPREPFRCLVSREDLTDRLPEIEAPALVVHGANDPAIPLEKAQALCAGLPNCEGVRVIAGAGHASNVSHPGEVNELLVDFCRRHAV